ncbi:MAG: hypothetical protein M3019_04680 [Candidatus Dormibacteraeota bacterium]|nr:hypothetical protein [Candidatus Dormibacteraeota bacterium]
MQPIGMIAALGAAGVSQLTSHLPWGWFTLMAIVDLGLIGVVIARRRLARSAARSGAGSRPSRAEALVLRSGWWVPQSRVLALPAQRASYAWPLHRDYMVRRLG